MTVLFASGCLVYSLVLLGLAVRSFLQIEED